MRGKLIAAAAIVVVTPLLIFQLAPSVIVYDRTGHVASIIVINDHYFQRVHRLPGGLFFALPKIEGAIEIQCRNGFKNREGYSQGQMHHFEAVDSASCQLGPGGAAAALNP